MKNYEKYAEEIKGYKGYRFCTDFIVNHIVKTSDCGTMDCNACRMRQMIWLMEEYEEPETDWSKVKVDTPILVRNNENTEWIRRHFAKYEKGDIWAWRDAQTSWTALNADDMTWWKYAKLAESEESEQE